MQTNNWLIHSKMVVYILVITFFLIYSVFDIQSLSLLISFLAILCIGLSLVQASLVTKIFSISFLTIGTIFVWNHGIGVKDFIGMFGEMLSLLSLFAIIPILAIPIKIGGYEETVNSLLRKDAKKTPFNYFRNITSLSYFFAIFLNLATLPLLYQSFKPAISRDFKTNQNRLISSSIIQGYSLPLIWSPLSAMVGVITTFTGVKLITIFPRLLLISIIPLFLNWLIFYIQQLKNKQLFQTNNQERAEDEPSLSEQSSLKKLLEVSLAIISLIFIIIYFDTTSSMSLLIISALISIPFAWLWSMCIGKTKEFKQASKSHFKQYIPNMHNLFAIFLSAGFFVSTLSYTGLDQAINHIVLLFSNVIPISLFLIILPMITLLTACVGLHPIVTIALLAQSLNPDLLGITAESLTIALLGGAVMTYFMSPFSGTMGVMSTLTKASAFRIVRWNVWAALAFYIILSVNLLMI